MSRSVQALYHYPVKSLGGSSVQHLLPQERGFADDRRWMFVDATGKFITRRAHAHMAKYRAECFGATGLRIIRITDEKVVAEIEQARPMGEPDIEVTLWDDVFHCTRVPAAKQAAEAIEMPDAQLVYMNEESQRPLDPRYARGEETVSFADGYPYLITTTASLDDLSERLDEEIDVRRFRPNIVVTASEPFEEDDWTDLKIGTHNFYLPKPCARCIMVTQDPQTGEKDLRILAELSRYRKVDNKVLFGMNAVWTGGEGMIKVGDRVVL